MGRAGARDADSYACAKVPHLAIKPQNLKLVRGEVKLLDMGLDRRPPSAYTETPDPYLAPEQWNNLPADERTDIYSLGATLFTLLTRDKLPNPSKRINPDQFRDVPKHVVDAIHRAMQAGPERRFQKVNAMLSALEAPSPATTIVLDGKSQGAAQPDQHSALLPQLQTALGTRLPSAVQVQLNNERRSLRDDETLDSLGLRGASSVVLFTDRQRPKPWMYAAGALAAVIVLVLALGFGGVSSTTSDSTPTAMAQAPTAAPVAVAPTAVPAATAPAEATAVPAATAPAATAPVPTVEPTAVPPEPIDAPCDVEQADVGDSVYTIAIIVPLGSPDKGDQAKARAMMNAACLAYGKMREKRSTVLTALPANTKIQLVFYDDKGQLDQAKPIANTIVDSFETGGVCGVGHRRSDLTNEVLPIYKNHLIPLFAPSNSDINVSANGGIRLAGNDAGQSAATIDFIQQGGKLSNATRLLIVRDTSENRWHSWSQRVPP